MTNIGLNRDNVSEVLQIYMEAHCGQTDLAPLAESLKTKAFQAHTPSQKASILAFLVNELSCSKSVVRCAHLPSLALYAYDGSGVENRCCTREWTRLNVHIDCAMAEIYIL